MSRPAAKILVIGIDAANPSLLLHWAEAGALPNVHALLERGLVGKTRNIEGFFVGSTWPSFYTGVTPARHGCHYLAQLRPETYDFYSLAEEGVARYAPFWTGLSQAGQRVAALDVPLTCIDHSLNGIQVVEWGSHDAVYGWQTSTPSLRKVIKSRFGKHPSAGYCDRIGRTAGAYEDFIRRLVEGARVKGELTKYFLGLGDWDFFIQVFTESHCAGHQCWHLHDANHPAHDADFVAVHGDPLLRVYASIDRAIGEIVAAAGETLVVLLVPHGMSHWYGAQFLLSEILIRLGVAAPPASASSPNHLATPVVERAKRAWRTLPIQVRQPVADVRRWIRHGASGGLPVIDVDVAKSVCFPRINGHPVSGIQLNLVGREPRGLLRTENAAAFCDQLSDDLLSIIDERTGQRLVKRVLRTRDLFRGEFLDELPDLLVEWSDELPTGSTSVGNGVAATVRISSPKIGVIQRDNAYCRTGEHRPDGLFIAASGEIRPGEVRREVSILDFAATFASRLAVELPAGDGQVIDELL